MTADPFKKSAGANDPASWNRFVYTPGDPINLYDPSGLDYTIPPGGKFDPGDSRNVNPGGTSITVPGGAPGDTLTNGGGAGSGGGPHNRIALPAELDGGGESGLPEEKIFKDVSDCVLSSVSDHFGLTAIAGLIAAFSQPIPKDLLPPYRSIGNPDTDLFSVLGYYIDITIPRLLNTNNLFRLVGRAGGYLAGFAVAVDVTVITVDSYKCYKQKNP